VIKQDWELKCEERFVRHIGNISVYLFHLFTFMCSHIKDFFFVFLVEVFVKYSMYEVLY
jgi:hypothetical protein